MLNIISNSNVNILSKIISAVVVYIFTLHICNKIFKVIIKVSF